MKSRTARRVMFFGLLMSAFALCIPDSDAAVMQAAVNDETSDVSDPSSQESVAPAAARLSPRNGFQTGPTGGRIIELDSLPAPVPPPVAIQPRRGGLSRWKWLAIGVGAAGGLAAAFMSGNGSGATVPIPVPGATLTPSPIPVLADVIIEPVVDPVDVNGCGDLCFPIVTGDGSGNTNGNGNGNGNRNGRR